MIRGDTKDFNFKIKQGDEYIDGSEYSEIELQINPQNTIHSIKKLKSKNDISWDVDHFTCFLSQEDTFKLREGTAEVQVRLYIGGDCKATMVSRIDIGKVLSKEVLG